MNRRAFVRTFAGGLLATPLAAEGQQAGQKVPVIGILTPQKFSDPNLPDFWGAFRQGLRDLGYVEGRNITLEYRSSEGRLEGLPDLAAELVRLNVDIIITQSTPATAAAKKATTTIPIIMEAVADPVGAGFVASLGQSRTNLTGFSLMSVDLGAKRLEFLKALIHKVSRVAVLWNPTNPAQRLMLPEAEGAARALGLTLQPVGLVDPGGLESAFETIVKGQAHAVVVFEDAMTVSNRRRIVELVGRHRLPAMYGLKYFVEAGGLISYGPNQFEQFRRAAGYVDKILRGTKPGDLPIEQPTKFELVINLKTAKALGLTIPPSLLQRADQVVE
jgi:putative ABC transport system substrate-binding protein